MTITINIDYFEQEGTRCPHCKQEQLRPEHIIDRLELMGRRVYRVECPFCHSNSTIQEKEDETRTQERTFSYHRAKYRK